MKFFITSIVDAGEGEIVLCVRSESDEGNSTKKLLLPPELYSKMNICKGECSEELFCRLLEESENYTAFRKGMYILANGSFSRKRLVQRLREKGFSSVAAEAAAEKIEQNGFLDEAAAACREAELCLRKLWGERRIIAQLYSKGYTKESVAQAMYSIEDSGADYAANCAELIRKKHLDGEQTPEKRKKAIASLLRYGYSMSQIKEAFAIIKI